MTSLVQPERFSLAVVKNVGSLVNHIIVEAIVGIKIRDGYVAGRLFAQAHNIWSITASGELVPTATLASASARIYAGSNTGSAW